MLTDRVVTIGGKDKNILIILTKTRKISEERLLKTKRNWSKPSFSTSLATWVSDNSEEEIYYHSEDEDIQSITNL